MGMTDRDEAHIRANILAYVNGDINRNIDELPFEGEVGALVSQRYTLNTGDLLILSNRIRVFETMIKARA